MATIRSRNSQKMMIGRLARHLEHEAFINCSDGIKRIWSNYTPEAYFIKAEKILLRHSKWPSQDSFLPG